MINMVIYLWQLDIQMVQFSIYGNLKKESLGIPWTNPQPWYVVVFHPHGFHPPTNLPSSSRNMSSHASTAFWKAALRPVAINNSVMAPMAYQRYTTVPFKRLKGGAPIAGWFISGKILIRNGIFAVSINRKPPLIIGKSPLIMGKSSINGSIWRFPKSWGYP